METQVFYFVYKTTNLINGKIYIGKHKTSDMGDRYIGSGKLLKLAISKYGLENFKFEVLEFFDTEQAMNTAEAELVTEEFCLQKDNYNLCVGGRGGFSYINRDQEKRKQKNQLARRRANESGALAKAQNAMRLFREDPQKVQAASQKRRETKMLKYGTNQPKKPDNFQHSADTRLKMSLSKKGKFKGSESSQFGTMWITNNVINKKIKSVDPIPDGWYKGRRI